MLVVLAVLDDGIGRRLGLSGSCGGGLGVFTAGGREMSKLLGGESGKRFRCVSAGNESEKRRGCQK